MNATKLARLTHLIAAVAAGAALTACGGGSSSSDSGGTPAPAPAPTPSVPVERIEPYDPGAAKAASAGEAEAAAPRALAAGQSVLRLALGPVDGGALPPLSATPGGVAPQIGVARDVPAFADPAVLSSRLHWADTGRGTRVAALSVTSEGAKGLRLGVLVRALPTGAVLRFYAQGGAEVVQATGQEVLDTVQRNLQAGTPDTEARTYWSPDFGGAETTLEIEIPNAAATASVQVAVPRVSHYVLSPDDARVQGFAKVGESGTCEIDVTCHPEYLDQSRSTARMTFVSGGKSYLCTGTLMNDMASSGTPYFLSANHCISTQAEASTLITDWFYRSASCNSQAVNPATQRRTGGATLLYATATTDTSFMRLNTAPPAGIVYAGSYFGTLAAGVGLAGVHHPEGDLQKLSVGILARFSTCASESCIGSDATNGTFLTMGWQQGVTEPGSSGSGLYYTIDSKRYVVGQLYGGSSSCLAPAGVDQYGRFDTAYRSAIKQWLNP